MIRPVSPVPHLRKCFPVERDSPDPAAHKLQLGGAALPAQEDQGDLRLTPRDRRVRLPGKEGLKTQLRMK